MLQARQCFTLQASCSASIEALRSMYHPHPTDAVRGYHEAHRAPSSLLLRAQTFWICYKSAKVFPMCSIFFA